MDKEVEAAASLLAEHPTTAETPGVVWDAAFDALVFAARQYVRLNFKD